MFSTKNDAKRHGAPEATHGDLESQDLESQGAIPAQDPGNPVQAAAQMKRQDAVDQSPQVQELTQRQTQLSDSNTSFGEDVAQRAYVGRRALGGNPLMNLLVDEDEHPNNHGNFHEHIFFEDGGEPGDQGFLGPQGVGQDNPQMLDRYIKVSPSYNDAIMRQAVAMHQDPGDYALFQNNCQAWVEEVLNTYDQLSGLSTHKTGSQPMKRHMAVEKEQDDLYEEGGIFEL